MLDDPEQVRVFLMGMGAGWLASVLVRAMFPTGPRKREGDSPRTPKDQSAPPTPRTPNGTHWHAQTPWEINPAPRHPPHPLPPFDERSACAMCGHRGADVVYRPYAADFGWCPSIHRPRRWSWEHMERRCRCGHVWAEQPGVRATTATLNAIEDEQTVIDDRGL